MVLKIRKKRRTNRFALFASLCVLLCCISLFLRGSREGVKRVGVAHSPSGGGCYRYWHYYYYIIISAARGANRSRNNPSDSISPFDDDRQTPDLFLLLGSAMLLLGDINFTSSFECLLMRDRFAN